MEAFWRPLKRARASISGPVQARGKENQPESIQAAAPLKDRRKRAQSLGGPLHTHLSHAKEEELSPKKRARRSLVGSPSPA